MSGVSAFFATPHSSGVAQMPGFPPAWDANPVNPNGTLEPVNPNAQYSLKWLEAWRVRQLFAETDLLYQFVQQVAALSGRAPDQYFRGGASAVDALETMVTNLVTASLQRETLQLEAAECNDPSMTKDQCDAKRKSLREAQLAMVDKMLSSVLGLGSGPRRGQGQGQGQEDRMEPARQQMQERLFRTAMEQFARKDADKRPGASAAAASASARTGPGPVSAPTVGGGVRVPIVQSAVRPDEMLHPPPTYRVLGAAPGPGPEPAPAGAPAQASGTHIDYKTVLMYLLMRGGITEAERKAAREIFDVDDGVVDPKQQRQMLQDMEMLERMLRRGATNTDFLNAPQHTGVIFFAPEFAAAVGQATDVVHRVCRKEFALEIDLMTHAEVRGAFARLVAYFVKRPDRERVSRYGTGRGDADEQRREYRGLVELFRHLRRVTTADADGKAMTVLTFECVDYGVPLRTAEARKRHDYEAARERYYSDVPQQRPFTAGGGVPL